MRCHKLMADTFSSIFQRISDRRLDVRIQSFGGCFNFRSKRRHKELSTHCWGIAIDLNPDTNRPGTVGTMPEGIVAIFKERGFVWGGDWPGPTRDPMHFQFCSGY